MYILTSMLAIRAKDGGGCQNARKKVFLRDYAVVAIKRNIIITEGRHRKFTVNGKTIFNLPGPASSFTDHNSISNIRRDRTRKRSVSVGENAKMIECFVVAKIFKFCHEHGQS